MTAAEFIAAQERLRVSRRTFYRRLGIGLRSGTAYALGRAPVPLTVALAIAAIEAGLEPPADVAAVPAQAIHENEPRPARREGPRKDRVTLMLDEDVISHLRATGNASKAANRILRERIEADQG